MSFAITKDDKLDDNFFLLAQDIFDNEKYQELQNYPHHFLFSILDHSKNVAHYTYRICSKLKLDYTSATRGALLHDFYSYDWRYKKYYGLKNHGMEHPKIALEQSMKYFSLNDIEKDVIRKHMFPLTLFAPKYKESIVVCAVDKYVSTVELMFVVQYLIKKKIKSLACKFRRQEDTQIRSQ